MIIGKITYNYLYFITIDNNSLCKDKVFQDINNNKYIRKSINI